MKLRIYLSTFLLTLCCLMLGVPSGAREFTVKSFELLPTDLYARTHPVKDFNGDVCALIKISLPERDCRIDGQVIKQSYDISEYLVYVSPDTRKLQIKYSGVETLHLDLVELLNGEELKPGSTYRLNLSGYEDLAPDSAKKKDSGVNYLILNITPSTGVSVKIDGNPQSVENGQTNTLLKYGTHEYLVEADGYTPARGTATIDKSGKTVLDIKLKSIMATLDVKAEDSDAVIKINNQTKGTGKFKGSLMPGLYQIEVTKDNYKPYSTTVELAQLENKTVSVPSLTPITGSLNVVCKPSGATISIDGKDVDTTPAVIDDVLIGQRQVTITKDGYEPLTLTATVSEDEITQLDGTLREKPKGEELYKSGKEALDAKDYTKAFKLLKEGAEHGDAACQNALGVMYSNGYGVTQDEAEAVKLFRKAADAGISKAMVNLGNMYFNGYGVTKDVSEAVKLFRKAAEADDASGMVNLGAVYDYGYGVPQDYVEAVKWYRKSAEAGNSLGMIRLGNMYYSGRGVSQDFVEAVKWYRKAIEAGDTNGMVCLGIVYENGNGLPQDYAEALKWYRKAVEAGNSQGMTRLGNMYFSGRGVSQDFVEAVKWYRKGADGGDSMAMATLGNIYYTGVGVNQDLEESLKWSLKAAEKGEPSAMVTLGLMYENGYGVIRDSAEAVKWYRKAADAGNEFAIKKLKEFGKK